MDCGATSKLHHCHWQRSDTGRTPLPHTYDMLVRTVARTVGAARSPFILLRRGVADKVAHAARVSASNAPVRGGKYTTEIAGLAVHRDPLPVLLELYHDTLSSLEAIPEGSVYRRACEALTRHRIGVVQRLSGQDGRSGGERAIESVESELDLGQIEEVLAIASDELSLSHKMLQWKA